MGKIYGKYFAWFGGGPKSRPSLIYQSATINSLVCVHWKVKYT